MGIKGTFHHYTIAVKNLSDSCHFYTVILGLEQLKRPDFDFEGVWFSIGPHLELHIIADESSVMHHSGSRQLHFAFAVTGIYSFRDHLIYNNVTIIKDIKPRSDGVLQLFIKDPDGYFIEITEL
ncbi:MAG: VOC family protein [Saprospiraceae bacterium]|nr:VOC family protein [Saprospiraceae bacterium]